MEALTLVAVALALLHLGFPLAYYAYLRAKWLGRPWSVRRDLSYKPRVTVIVPTYNEAELIESKLDELVGRAIRCQLIGLNERN